MIRFLSLCIFSLFISVAWADDFFSPPDLDTGPPPWLQNDDNAAGENESEPEGVTVSPGPDSDGPPPGFWGDEDSFDDELDQSFGFPSSAPSSNQKPRDSFQLVEPWKDVLGDDKQKKTCLGWGHPLLGVKMYQEQRSCSFGLSQKVQVARQSIALLEDKTKNLVLREVIAGNISHQASKAFKPKYDLILDALQSALIEGCRCLQ